MSVAFRRESDEQHLEPKFELPLPPGPNLVTARGRALIDDRIAALEAAQAGATDETSPAIARDLRYWKTRRATALVTGTPDDGSIGFGSTVEIVLAGKRRVIVIVGDDEADPPAGRIAFSAPLARALIGAEIGDVLAFNGRDDAIVVEAVR